MIESYTRDIVRNESQSKYQPLGIDKIFRSEPSNLKMKLGQFFDENNEEIGSKHNESDDEVMSLDAVSIFTEI